MTISFDILGEEGAALLSELQALSFKGSPEQLWPAEEFSVLLQGVGVAALIILQDSEPIGFILSRTVIDEVEIISICVLPHWQGRGMASRLMAKFLADLSHRNMAHIFLEVRADNLSAIALYEKMCFIRVGLRKDYYTGAAGQKEDAVIMKKTLSASS